LTYQTYEEYVKPAQTFWEWLQESWEEFVIQYSGGLKTLSDATFNFFCSMFCDWMRGCIHDYLESNIEQMKERRSHSSY
jgi:hypothetical protein